MNLETVWQVATSGRLGALHAMIRASAPFYTVYFVVTAGKSGLLQLLSRGPHTAREIGKTLDIAEGDLDPLIAWLDVGVAIGELSLSGEQYSLAGSLAETLSAPEHDALLAVLEEMAGLHAQLLRDTPGRLKHGQRLTLKDQDGEVVARSSRLLEPFVHEAIGRAIPTTGQVRVLEIGCGSGTYLRHMLKRNPNVRVHGIELQPEVAELARRNLLAWGVAERATIEVQDIRARPVGEPFDVVTMHNNIYYFEESARPALFRQVAQHLRPGGTLLLSTACRGGSPGVALLNLWGAMTQGCGPLPTSEELCRQLRLGDLVDVVAWNVGAPLESFWAFMASRP
ncbi:MAG TPA: methyltransferase domain-containing protein [Pseudomonadota bacterium]|nr:methyltransferase domain-containing protein [Pseudomonadota bacterium]